MYTYRVIKENVINGQRAKRSRTISRYEPLKVGGLYMHLGKGFSGAYRMLEAIEEGSEIQ